MNEVEIAALLEAHYGVRPLSLARPAAGVGGDTWIVTCPDRKLVLKFPQPDGMNHPELEPALCAHLCSHGVPACRFVPNLAGEFLSRDGEGRIFHVQTYIPGTVYGLNEAPDWLLTQAAGLLGRIHIVLNTLPPLPEGIGPGFFTHMTPARALTSYRASLALALERGDGQTAEALRFRMDLCSRLPPLRFDLSRLRCRNTHGDYSVSQFICGEGEIRAVIDWTSACVHPCVWELIRSYVYAAPRCRAGQVDIPGFLRYLEAYLAAAPLGRDDLLALPSLFFYQLAVCDYYWQYDHAATPNRSIFLHQAQFSTALLRWFDGHEQDLQDALASVRL